MESFTWSLDTLSPFLLTFFCGVLLGFGALWLHFFLTKKQAKQLAERILADAQLEGDNLLKQHELVLKQKSLDHQKELDLIASNERKKQEREEERIKQREEKCENRMSLVEKKLTDLEKRETLLASRKDHFENEKIEVAALKNALNEKFEKIAGLTTTEAKQQLLASIQTDIRGEVANYTRRMKKEAEEDAERSAAQIIATAIQRMAVPCASECTVNTVALPSEELKGRIIGREGRNIRTLEKFTGVNFIIDDTPGALVLSGYDPIRLHVAKLTMNDLISDGRIHPTRIEEAVEKAQTTTQKLIKQYGEDAALRAGCVDLHPEIHILLGKLKFRTSYGQNVLEHSLEVSHLMGMMAQELGLDSALAKRIGLLHDMGKAVSHEIEGTHALIGHDLALRYGESKDVANGIGCHHFEIEPTTIEGSLCSAADAISASRPGARIEALEEYTKRLKKLEQIAYEFPGVEKAYSMQAGREIRVIVEPELIDDEGTILLARDLTRRIEKEMSYPGKIKVMVIREKKAVEYAI